MRTIGIILLVLAGLNLFFAIMGVANGVPSAEKGFSSALVVGVVGCVCLIIAKNKKKRKEERDRWENG